MLRVFDSDDDRNHYGYSDRALNYMKLSVSSYLSTLTIEDRTLRDESDYIKVDDTWLKVYKIMLDTLRDNFLQERRTSYKEKDVAKYIGECKA